LYQARLQHIHNNYQEEFQRAKDSKTAKKLRVQLFQQLVDAETSFKIVRKRPDILQLSPDQLQQALKPPMNLSFPSRKKRRASLLEKYNHT
jgi:hypothetical protein